MLILYGCFSLSSRWYLCFFLLHTSHFCLVFFFVFFNIRRVSEKHESCHFIIFVCASNHPKPRPPTLDINNKKKGRPPPPLSSCKGGRDVLTGSYWLKWLLSCFENYHKKREVAKGSTRGQKPLVRHGSRWKKRGAGRQKKRTKIAQWPAGECAPMATESLVLSELRANVLQVTGGMGTGPRCC